MKRTFYILILPILIFGFFSIAEAHQPRLIYKTETSLEKPYIINNYDVSQAFYGELSGKSDFYSVAIHNPDNLYLQLLAPDLKDANTDFSAEVSLIWENNSKFVFKLSGGEWGKYHEEYANDDYLQGPEKTLALGKGLYQIKVFNPKNEGKYVLVVGKKESFPIGEIINTAISLPSLKIDFFDKPFWTAYYNKAGLFLGGGLLVILIIFYFIKRFFRRPY